MSRGTAPALDPLAQGWHRVGDRQGQQAEFSGDERKRHKSDSPSQAQVSGFDDNSRTDPPDPLLLDGFGCCSAESTEINRVSWGEGRIDCLVWVSHADKIGRAFG